jgi:hypothetical protein
MDTVMKIAEAVDTVNDMVNDLMVRGAKAYVRDMNPTPGAVVYYQRKDGSFDFRDNGPYDAATTTPIATISTRTWEISL